MFVPRTVSVVTLGCARNEVDSEELAARLGAGGWTLVADADEASVVLVNTCGFIEAAKRESIDTLLGAADSGAKVVAAGCLAERYGAELAGALPEADAVLGFDDYPDIGSRLDDMLARRPHVPHAPRDRRRLLPLAPAERRGASDVHVPGHAPVAEVGDLPEGVAPASGPRPLRRRLAGGPVAPLKIASGCDRRCTFCAIPTFRGSFVSRPPDEILAEAHWLAGQGVRELVLVSENSTEYGKDLGDLRLLEKLLPDLAAVPGIVRVRVSYLQPAEVRPGLIDVMTSTPGVAPYFDLSFQHASATVLRRMRRFGDGDHFLALLDQIRDRCPDAGVRSNFIVGFPGETRADVAELERFLTAASLDGIGVFAYSAEDDTEAATYPGRVRGDTVARRLDRVGRLAEELTAQRAEDRMGSIVEVLVEHEVSGGVYEGRAAHQAPEVDGGTTVHGDGFSVGDVVRARVREAVGVDLVADGVGAVSPA
ncbi:MAG: 30S ribosomal protein S12 methylthiotransferase RimO [Streptosporangiales bacterium]|nr:30S ribosomal protein S12 methylthiotransferase RimO [Streptosporangiales bacterium]